MCVGEVGSLCCLNVLSHDYAVGGLIVWGYGLNGLGPFILGIEVLGLYGVLNMLRFCCELDMVELLQCLDVVSHESAGGGCIVGIIV